MAMHKDPKNRLLAAVGLLIMLVAAGAVGGWFAQPAAVDERWATYDDPVLVGRLDGEGKVTRDVTADGTPIVYNNLVHVVFQRCGPVAPVEVDSSRTWVLASPDGNFVGLPGGTISAEIGVNVNDGCSTFELDYEFPMDAADRIGRFAEVCTDGCAEPTPISLRFTLDPFDDRLGPLVIETEVFFRAEDLTDPSSPTIEVIDTKDETP